ncbi:uncharacterized protein B0P05DRAFT_595253 [Gilbertella persicaria]|uniref:uncharacterized protein n=1 Tax=Gilbertella persicaria TaxID=101096 RepID=UPI00221FEE7D|nr:uncharacterized protein B0P05DRAFT_595253 [Gilbertella persicaria]KAI8085770.1 hypothetical protein B0P05DRAFT_595253 [Gilbertella persicaria]
MVQLSVAIRDLFLNIFVVIANNFCLLLSVWNIAKSLVTSAVGKKNKIIPKVVAITGANSGIGEGLAHAYAKDKVSLVLIARNMERLEKVAEACKELGSPSIKIVQMDVSNTQAVTEFLEEKTNEYKIDLFIANAGIALVPGLDLLDQAEKVLQINVMGAIAGINAVYKSMKARGQGGQIAVVSSICGFFGPPYIFSYSASKAAVMTYCKDLRALGKDDGIAINTIAPGYVDTAMTTTFSKTSKYFYLSVEKHAELVKKALEEDIGLISYPSHQYLSFAVFATIPPAAKEALAHAAHYFVDPILRKLDVDYYHDEKKAK